MEKRRKRAVRTRKKKSHALNVEKKGITQTNATKNSAQQKNGKDIKQNRVIFLVMNDNQHGYSSDKDNTERPYAYYDFTAIQGANEENEESEEEDNESESSNNQDVNNEPSDESFIDEDKDNEYEGFAFLHNNVVCSTQDKAGIPKTWILLGSQSTVDAFYNLHLLTNICKSKIMLMLHCNAGKAIVTKRVI